MFTVEQIEQAHARVKSGADFPQYIRDIKHLGVTGFETWVNDSHTVYWGKGEERTQSQPQYALLTISSLCNSEQFRLSLKIHQQGQTDYYTFCQHCAQTGVERWVVRLDAMTCTYYDIQGNEVLVEAIPQ
jgi:uncharacterized protein YbcV (DUF1398 family)